MGPKIIDIQPIQVMGKTATKIRIAIFNYAITNDTLNITYHLLDANNNIILYATDSIANAKTQSLINYDAIEEILLTNIEVSSVTSMGNV